jgi:RNA polymerase sigma-70 factor (ECF subfamily)
MVNRNRREERSRVSPGDFVEMVEPHYAGLVQRLTLVLHDADDARDVAQDAYLRAWRAWNRFDGADTRGWLHTIGLRLAFNRRRTHRRGVAAFQRSATHAPPWVPDERLDLWAALGDLRPPERAALLLNVLDGYTQAEIAEMLDAPPGTVASWIAAAKRRLRAALATPQELGR